MLAQGGDSLPVACAGRGEHDGVGGVRDAAIGAETAACGQDRLHHESRVETDNREIELSLPTLVDDGEGKRLRPPDNGVGQAGRRKGSKTLWWPLSLIHI